MPLTAEQLETRRSGIGGSDAAAAVGMSRWKSSLALYLEKRGEIEPGPVHPAMVWGNRLEGSIRQAYTEEVGVDVTIPDGTPRSREHPFMLFHPDGITADGRLFEAKTARSDDDWGDAGSAEVPIEYWMQVQHGMAVMGLPVADIAVLFFGSDFRIYRVPADREAQDLLIKRERAFWRRVVEGNPPQATSPEDVRLLFGSRSDPIGVQASPEALALVEQLAEVRVMRRAIEDREEEIETKVKLAMGSCELLLDGTRTVATWKMAKAAERLDAAEVRRSFPEAYAACVRTGAPSRRFLLK